MKVVAAICSAIWCAATEGAPNKPIKIGRGAEHAALEPIVSPIGPPSLNSWRNAASQAAKIGRRVGNGGTTVDQNDDRQRNRHGEPDDRAADPAADQAEPWHAEMTEDH